MKIIILLSVVALTGCANFTSPARLHSLGGNNYWFDYDASRRGALLLTKQDQARYVICSEPAPDVALELVNKLEGKLTAKNIEIADAKGELTVSAIKLAERTQMVMFLRESLYRLCELSMSNSFSASESKDMYLKVLDTALQLVEKDKSELKVESAKAEKKAEEAKTLNSLIKQGLTPQQLNKYLDR